MENKYLGRAIGQEEETEVIMTGQSAAEAYKKMLEMAENAKDFTTNFDRITESPEALAATMREVALYCYTCKTSQNAWYKKHKDKCPCKLLCEGTKKFTEWLKQESE